MSDPQPPALDEGGVWGGSRGPRVPPGAAGSRDASDGSGPAPGPARSTPSVGSDAASSGPGGDEHDVPCAWLERVLKGLALIFWAVVCFLGFYALALQLQGGLSWVLLHEVASGVAALLVALSGTLFEMRETWGYLEALGRLSRVRLELVQLVLFLTAGGCVASGPWSGRSPAAEIAGRAACCTGPLLGAARVALGCCNQGLRRRSARCASRCRALCCWAASPRSRPLLLPERHL